MLREANEAQAYFKKEFGEGNIPPAGTYAIPTTTSKGKAFMKVVINESGFMNDFKLFWDKELTISWYENKKPNFLKNL